MPDVAIRTLEEPDLDLLFSPRSRPWGERWLERQARAGAYIAVAEVDGVPVARIGLDFERPAEDGVCTLWAAHVGREWRSRGIGTRLMRHLERVATERGFVEIELGVNKQNGRARSLYERLGYVVCGEDVQRWTERVDGDDVEVVEDVWLMRKRIG